MRHFTLLLLFTLASLPLAAQLDADALSRIRRAETLQGRMDSLMLASAWQEAEATGRELLTLHLPARTERRVRIWLSNVLLAMGSYQDALDLTAGASDPDCQINRASALFRMGKAEEALQVLDTLPSDTVALINKAYILWHLRQNADAAVLLQSLLPDMPPSRLKAVTQANLALILNDTALIDEALNFLRTHGGEEQDDFIIALRKRAEISHAAADFRTWLDAERRHIARVFPTFTPQRRLDFWAMKRGQIAEVLWSGDCDLAFEAALFRRQITLLPSACSDPSEATRVRLADIRQALTAQQAAVEFVCYTSAENGDTLYAALMATRDEPCRMAHIQLPEYVRQAVNSTSRKDKNRLYTDTALTRMVWQPVLEALPRGVNVIHFAPDGILHTLAVEYLPGMDGYELHRLASTAEVVGQKRAGPARPAAQGDKKGAGAEGEGKVLLVGALDYDRVPTDEVPEESAAQTDATNHDAADYLHQVAAGARFSPLRHSQMEVAEADSLLSGTDILTAASERRVRQRLPHYTAALFSTHGYALDTDRRTLPLTLRDSILRDASLLASGVALAGANEAYKSTGEPDGILSALEISRLPLDGLRFVALSACQTALGRTTDEGPAGLLRAFKKAGAGKVLASLWEVDDAATRLLMYHFHRHLSAGADHFQALRQAQADVRAHTVRIPAGFNAARGCFVEEQVYAPYTDPYFWAAFILME